MVWCFQVLDFFFFFYNNICTALLVIGYNGCSFILKFLINVLVIVNTSAMANVLLAISLLASNIAMSSIGVLQPSVLLPHLLCHKLCQLKSDYVAGALSNNNLGLLGTAV